jgi:hypothetical protein
LGHARKTDLFFEQNCKETGQKSPEPGPKAKGLPRERKTDPVFISKANSQRPGWVLGLLLFFIFLNVLVLIDS